MADKLGVSRERESIWNTILFEAYSQKNKLKKGESVMYSFSFV